MEYWLASARTEDISEGRKFPLAGIVTNPSLIAQAGPAWRKTLQSLDSTGFGPVHVQTVSCDPRAIVEQARTFRELLKHVAFIAKVPICDASLQAIPALKSMGLIVNVTAVCTVNQAAIAMAYGADLVSAYVHRITEQGGNGYAVVENIRKIIDRDGYNARIMAVSIRNVQQLEAITLAGAHAVAISLPVLKQAVTDELSTRAIQGFAEDWKKIDN